MQQHSAALVRCQSYNQKEVDAAVQRAFDLLGGLKQWIHPGMKVAIKVNLLMKKKPEGFTTTHPAVVEAVVKQVQALGAQAVIVTARAGRLPLRRCTVYTKFAEWNRCRRGRGLN